MVYFLGDDRPNAGKGFQIILLLICLVILSWYGTNYPKLWETARTFWLLGLLSMVGILVSFTLTKAFGVDYNAPISEEPNLVGIEKRYLYVVAIISFFLTFFVISRTNYSMLPPGFQIVALGTFGELLLYVSAAITENFFFFSVILGLVFTLLRYALGSENDVLSLGLLCLIIPTIFMLFHFFVYGFVDMISSMATFIFALEMVLWMIVFKDLTYPHMRHIGNNIGITIFSTFTLTSFFVAVITGFWFWLLVFIVLAVWVIRRM